MLIINKEIKKTPKVSIITATLNSEKYFKELYELKNLCKVSHLSMGMSADYLIATKYKSSFLRIGSSIFGPRN